MAFWASGGRGAIAGGSERAEATDGGGVGGERGGVSDGRATGWLRR